MAGMKIPCLSFWGDEMIKDAFIRKALDVWQENAPELKVSDHLSEETLYRLACPGGIAGGTDEEVEHLSSCTLCRREWNSWMESLDILTDEEERLEDGGMVLSGGLLKAASASLFSETVTLESGCGRFELSIFPNLDQPDRAMVVIEVKMDMEKLEGKYCVVRDGTAAVILKGVIEDGRCAGRIASLSTLDLKTWTVQVHSG